MTHKEAIKNLTELQLRLINDNSEEAIEYNKKIYDTLAYFITQTIPLSVIEDIKAEITGNLESIIGKYDSSTPPRDMPSKKCERNCGRQEALDIIDRKIKEIRHEYIRRFKHQR